MRALPKRNPDSSRGKIRKPGQDKTLEGVAGNDRNCNYE